MNVNYNYLGGVRGTDSQKNRTIEGSRPQSTVTRTSWWLTCCFMMLSLFVGQSAFAQTVTIGSGNNTGSKLPVVPFYGYSYSQQIILKSELATSGNITKLSFYSSGAAIGSNSNTWTIYMGHTTKSTFGSNTDWILSSAMTQVFSGTVPGFPEAGWFTITLTTPFAYNNVDNLVVSVDENGEGYNGSSSYARIWTTPVANRAIYYQDDSVNPDPATINLTGIRTTYMSQMQLEFASSTAPSCATAHAPANLATNIVRNPILTWANGGGAMTYDVYFGNSSNPALIGNQTGTSYTPSLLNANTTYYWKIIPKNVIGAATGCIERSFMTGSTILYCTPSSTSSATYINNFSTSLGSTNISNESVYTTGGYQDNYATSAVTSFPTGSFNYNMTVTGGTLGVAIWVDWNSNGTFEASEKVFNTTSYSSGPFTGSIAVPMGTTPGDYRMRVMVDYNNSNPVNPCNTTGSRTETEDYKLTVGAPPSCLMPSEITSSAITTNSATISWTASTSNASSGYDYYYSTSNQAPTASTPATGSVGAGITSANLTGLSGGTTYYIWVRLKCSVSDVSGWTAAHTFTTACETPVAQPTELVFGTITTTSISGSFTAASPAPTKYLVVRSDSATAPSPQNGTTYTSGSTALGTGTLVVQNSSSTTFTSSGLTVGTPYYYYIFALNDGVCATAYNTNSPLTGSISTRCSTATALGSNSITTTSAIITWTGTGTYIVEYGVSGFTPGTGATAGTGGTIASGSISPVTLSGLSASTAYRVFIRQICASGGYSANSTAHNFTTLCEAITAFPAVEEFNTVAPACWTRFSGGDLVAGPSTSTSSKWISDGFLNVGSTGAARANIFSTNATHWLISNDYVLPGSGSLQVSYDVGATEYGETTALETPWEEDDFLELLLSNNGTNWVVLKTYNSTNVPSNLGQVDVASLSAYAGQTVRFAFRTVEGAANGSADIDFFVDNFRVGAAPGAPNCATNLMPENAAVNVDRNVVLTWSSAADATSYDVYLGTSSTPVFVANVTGTSYSPALLAANTTYYFSVTPTNDAGDATGCAVHSFTTGTNISYCSSVPTSNDNAGITNVQIGSTDFPIADVTYSDQTASPVDVVNASNVNLQITFGTEYAYDSNVWIDFNDNGTFEASELVFSGTSTSDDISVLNASFDIPAGSALGMHRMRIGTSDGEFGSGQNPPNPCYSGTYGVTVDFMINITGDCATSTFYADEDGDGYGEASMSVEACDAPAGYVANSTDCDDTNALVWRTGIFFVDVDGDEYTAGLASVCYGVGVPAGYSETTLGQDCNDNDASTYRSGSFFVDADGDGYTMGESMIMCYGANTPTGYAAQSLGMDCDDSNAAIYQSSMLFVDNDGDGYTVGEATSVCYGATIPAGYVIESMGVDCDDDNAALYQSIMVYADNDGDGYTVGDAIAICFGTAVPAGYTEISLGEDCNDNNANVWQSMMLFVDNDGDGYTMGEASSICYGSTMPEGYAQTSLGADCDDNNANVWQSMMLFVDMDGDGYTMGEATSVCYGASIPEGYAVNSLGVDCNDNDATAWRSVTVYIDMDGDGFHGEMIEDYCYGSSLPSNYSTTTLGLDCNDNNAAINPNATEIPGNGIDENCNGMQDDVLSDIATTTIRAEFCGATVGHLDNIFPVGIIGATGYKFNIYDASGTTLVASIENSYSRFRFAQFNFDFNATYQVRVQTKVGNEYSAEGASCIITLRDVPTTTIRDSQCGATVQPITNIFPIGITGATSYIWNIYDASGTTLIGSVQNAYSRLRAEQFNYTMGSTYLVKVQVVRHGLVGLEGEGCYITVGASNIETKVSSGATVEVKIVAYPNPFSETFSLDITRGTEGAVEVQVYDMIGKLLEVRSVLATDLTSLTLGNRYPQGVYNIVVTHGELVKTLRVVKR